MCNVIHIDSIALQDFLTRYFGADTDVADFQMRYSFRL